MKFLMAVGIYLFMGVMLAWGILMATHGKPALLLAVIITYLAVLLGIGCLPKKSHH
jgi:hypothetical protein